MQDALINFRVSPEERQRLRILLLQEGSTLQEFFAGVLKQKLAEAETPVHDCGWYPGWTQHQAKTAQVAMGMEK